MPTLVRLVVPLLVSSAQSASLKLESPAHYGVDLTLLNEAEIRNNRSTATLITAIFIWKRYNARKVWN